MILNRIVSSIKLIEKNPGIRHEGYLILPSFDNLSNFSPFIPKHLMSLNELLFFCLIPLLFADLGIQMIVPSKKFHFVKD